MQGEQWFRAPLHPCRLNCLIWYYCQHILSRPRRYISQDEQCLSERPLPRRLCLAGKRSHSWGCFSATFFRGSSDSRLDPFVMSRGGLSPALTSDVTTHQSDHRFRSQASHPHFSPPAAAVTATSAAMARSYGRSQAPSCQIFIGMEPSVADMCSRC